MAVRLKSCSFTDHNCFAQTPAPNKRYVKLQTLVKYDQDGKGEYFMWEDVEIAGRDDPDHVEVLYED